MPQSKAHIAATMRYEINAYDKVLLRIRKDRKDGGPSKEMISSAAKDAGLSLNAFILQAVREKMEGGKYGVH